MFLVILKITLQITPFFQNFKNSFCNPDNVHLEYFEKENFKTNIYTFLSLIIQGDKEKYERQIIHLC